jgi:hypothetical protein
MSLMQHRREWLEMEARDIIRSCRQLNFSRQDARTQTLIILCEEMQGDGLSFALHHIEVEQIVDSELDKLYGTESKVDVEALDTQATQENGILRDIRY